jgi:hypothetical protein
MFSRGDVAAISDDLHLVQTPIESIGMGTDLIMLPPPGLPAPVARGKIMAIQQACQSLPDGQRMDESPPLQHHLAPGIYAREIHLAGGTLVVGKIHRHRHFNIISQGSITCYTEFGLEHHSAPASFISEPGTKRVVYTHEDAIWTTIHPNPTNEQDITKLEEMFTALEYAELGMAVIEKELIT